MRAALRPSVEWWGGILMSTIARSGTFVGDQFQEPYGVTGLARHLVADALAETGQPLPEQDVVVGEDDPSPRGLLIGVHGLRLPLARPVRCALRYAPNSLPEHGRLRLAGSGIGGWP